MATADQSPASGSSQKNSQQQRGGPDRCVACFLAALFSVANMFQDKADQLDDEKHRYQDNQFIQQFHIQFSDQQSAPFRDSPFLQESDDRVSPAVAGTAAVQQVDRVSDNCGNTGKNCAGGQRIQ